LVAAANRLSRAVDQLTFGTPVTHVYNPLAYARKAHHQYLRMSQPASTQVLFLGMNPGPWGMAQTGVPFGEVGTVKHWLGINAEISKPAHEHPKRKVEGLACKRSEVSGQRLWGLFQERFHTPQRFFHEHFVINYCPLVFMESTGRNRTPDKLPAQERAMLDQVCDDHLRSVIQLLAPVFLVGVGAYAEACLARATALLDVRPQVLRILHPSPASPAANRGWAARATQELVDAGVWARL
jgi:single-strand selective monofunctional uracil DNA glycosylase